MPHFYALDLFPWSSFLSLYFLYCSLYCLYWLTCTQSEGSRWRSSIIFFFPGPFQWKNCQVCGDASHSKLMHCRKRDYMSLMLHSWSLEERPQQTWTGSNGSPAGAILWKADTYIWRTDSGSMTCTLNKEAEGLLRKRQSNCGGNLISRMNRAGWL